MCGWCPVSGILHEVCFEEGERVSVGLVVVRVEVSGLDARTGKAEVAIREAEARLRLAEVGPGRAVRPGGEPDLRDRGGVGAGGRGGGA
jgi:pyruvate/2-oxoglutarate dehydrogenase complex dihydrolipoamide acyltransferase (E2) component